MGSARALTVALADGKTWLLVPTARQLLLTSARSDKPGKTTAGCSELEAGHPACTGNGCAAQMPSEDPDVSDPSGSHVAGALPSSPSRIDGWGGDGGIEHTRHMSRERGLKTEGGEVKCASVKQQACKTRQFEK